MRPVRLDRSAAVVFFICTANISFAAGEPGVRAPRYLVTLQGASDFLLKPELPQGSKIIAPQIGGTFGVRLHGDYEVHLEFTHSFVRLEQTSVGVNGMDHLGLAMNYSPQAFFGWFYQVRANWANGSVSPGFTTSRFSVGAGLGYSWVPGRFVEIRPVAGFRLTPASTRLGDQLWPLASVGVQVVFKAETLTQFILSVFGTPAAL